MRGDHGDPRIGGRAVIAGLGDHVVRGRIHLETVERLRRRGRCGRDEQRSDQREQRDAYLRDRREGVTAMRSTPFG